MVPPPPRVRADGSGPLFRRRYRVRIEGGRLTPEQLMAELLRDPNRGAPIEVAVFRKTRGGQGPLRVGDEEVAIQISAPPAELTGVLDSALGATERRGVAPRITGHAGVGTTYVALSGGDEEARVQVVEERGISQVSDAGAIEEVVDRVFADNADTAS